MKNSVVSNEATLSVEAINRIFEENGFEGLEIEVKDLRKGKESGYGHYWYAVELTINDQEIDLYLNNSATSMMYDIMFDEDAVSNSDYYDTVEQVSEECFSMIIQANEWKISEIVED